MFIFIIVCIAVTITLLSVFRILMNFWSWLSCTHVFLFIKGELFSSPSNDYSFEKNPRSRSAIIKAQNEKKESIHYRGLENMVDKARSGKLSKVGDILETKGDTYPTIKDHKKYTEYVMEGGELSLMDWFRKNK